MGDNAEKFFKKIQYVFDFVRQQEDVVLLWRPHPLMRATIHSMNPVVAVKYDELVEQYKSTGWGIYDETADLNRSIAISDMYYGDWSSVATMFQEAGKPVMLESLYVTQKKDLNNFWAGNILVEEEGIWLVMGSCNSLFYYDKRDNSLQFKAKIEEEQGASLYHKIVRYKE